MVRTAVGATAIAAGLALAACSPSAEKPAAQSTQDAATETAAAEPAPVEAATVEAATVEAAPAEVAAADGAADAAAQTGTEAPVDATASETVAAPTGAVAATAAPAAGVMLLEIRDASGAQLSGDADRGKRVFAQCATCHSAEQGVNRVGPSLYGIVGRPAGSIPGFRYSTANKNSGITWTEQEMFTYLENPKKRIPGTIMAFVGLRDAQQRADVIAYLKANAAQ